MATIEKFDVLVLGAGPAGSMAAQHAVKGGCSVALIERKERVGIPVRCAEGVGLKGTSLSITLKKEWIQTYIKSLKIVSPGGLVVYLNDLPDSYVLDREIFDYELVQQAINEGVTYFNATPIESVQFNQDHYICQSTTKKFIGSVVIIADGVESRLARELGWDTTLSDEDIESCAFCRIKHKTIRKDQIIIYTGSKIAPGGYAWVWPRTKGFANVGLGVLGNRSSSGLAKIALHKFIDKYYPGGEINELHSGGVPVGKWLKPLVKKGALVVGDAARQVNCLTGGGIAYAIYAGKLAGETVAESYTQFGTVNYRYLKKYQHRWQIFGGKEQLRTHALKSMVIKSNDAFFDKVARSLLGKKEKKISYLRLFLHTFARHPILLLKAFLLYR